MKTLPREFPLVFLISPARIGGPRSNTLLRPQAGFDLAVRQTLGYGGTLRQVRSHPALDAAGGIGALLRF